MGREVVGSKRNSKFALNSPLQPVMSLSYREFIECRYIGLFRISNSISYRTSHIEYLDILKTNDFFVFFRRKFRKFAENSENSPKIRRKFLKKKVFFEALISYRIVSYRKKNPHIVSLSYRIEKKLIATQCSRPSRNHNRGKGRGGGAGGGMTDRLAGEEHPLVGGNQPLDVGLGCAGDAQPGVRRDLRECQSLRSVHLQTATDQALDLLAKLQLWEPGEMSSADLSIALKGHVSADHVVEEDTQGPDCEALWPVSSGVDPLWGRVDPGSLEPRVHLVLYVITRPPM